MRSKNLALVFLAAIIVIPLIIIMIDYTSIDFSFNLVKYHSAEADGKTFSFYGSFGTVGKIKVSDKNGKLCAIRFSADADIFKEDIPAIEVCDVNGDEKNDLLILKDIDEEGDVHRTLFIAEDSGFTKITDADIANFKLCENTVISEEITLEYMAQTVEEYIVPYKRSAVRKEYKYSDGELYVYCEYSLSYYSETDVYCHAYWEYNSDIDELDCVFEDWLSPEQYAQSKQDIQKSFDITLP